MPRNYLGEKVRAQDYTKGEKFRKDVLEQVGKEKNITALTEKEKEQELLRFLSR